MLSNPRLKAQVESAINEVSSTTWVKKTVTEQKEEESEGDQGEEKTNTQEEEDQSNAKQEENQQDEQQNEPEKEEEVLNGRKVPVSEIEEFIKQRVETLNSMEAFASKTTLNNIRAIGDSYWNRSSVVRMKISDTMIENGFPDLVVKMLKYFNDEGLFKNDDTWFPAYYTLNTLWNYTDTSIPLCKELAEKGLVKLLVENIRHQPYLENLTSKNVFYVVKSSLSTIQNISKCPELKNLFDEEKTVDALRHFTTATDDFLKTVSLMSITALISESENATLTDTGAIPFMVKTIRFALRSSKRRHRGFSPEELTVCLARMAVNDSNKMKIVDVQALPLFLSMLNHNDEGEQKAVAGAIWNLAFDKDVREKIKAEPGMIEALEKLAKNSDSDEVRKSCKGALWVIQEKNKESAAKVEDNEKGDKEEQHIFISYNWGNQEVVLKIVEKLKNDGFKVWVDVDQMGGSTLEAMALGIEKARLVVICMSEKYKLSPNCRTEAEYTFQLKKPMLPLMMQRHYKPDGWLGMLLGAKFYINMDGKYPLEQAYPMMARELGRNFASQNNDEVEVSSAQQEVFSAAPPAEPAVNYGGPVFALKDEDKIQAWTKEQVAEWMTKNELESMMEKFARYDGKLLIQLIKMRREAPEFYYRSLESKMELELTDILHLNAAFETL